MKHFLFSSFLTQFYAQYVIALATAARNGVVGACVEALAAGEEVEQRSEVSSCLDILTLVKEQGLVCN